MYTYFLALGLPRESKFGRTKIYFKNRRKYGNFEENIWIILKIFGRIPTRRIAIICWLSVCYSPRTHS